MSNKKLIILAVVFGLITALAVNFYLARVKAALSNVQRGPVVVAKVPIPAKTELKSEMLETRTMPREFIHPKAVVDANNLLGKITLVDIVGGEQVLSTRIASGKDDRNGLAYVIPKGLRAVSVGINQVTGVSGLVQPGDKVDVVGLLETDTESKGVPVAKIMLQNIEVLAVDQKLDPGARLPENKDKGAQEGKTVTLAVKPEDAEKLVLVTERGVIRIILRSPVDEGNYVPKPYTPKEFLIR